MTAGELRNKMNTDYGVGEWPKTLEVDPETYANACQAIFHSKEFMMDSLYIQVALGEHKGIMFRNVELLLTRTK